MQPHALTSPCSFEPVVSQKRTRPSSPPRPPVHSMQPPSVSPPPPDRRQVRAESPSPPPSDLHWRNVAHELFKSLPTAFSEHRSVMQNLAAGEALAQQAAQYLARAKESAVASSDVLRFAVHIKETCAQLQLKLDNVAGDCIHPLTVSHLFLTLHCSSGRASTHLSRARAECMRENGSGMRAI